MDSEQQMPELHPVEQPKSEEDKRKEEKLKSFRLFVIYPAIHNSHGERSNAAFFNKRAQELLPFPDGSMQKVSRKTMERWLRNYKQADSNGGYGGDGLKNKTRSDKGRSRKMSLNTMYRVVEILNLTPNITVAKIVRRLVKEGYIKDKQLSEDTVSRFITNYDLRNKAVVEERIRRSFVKENFGDLVEADTCYLVRIPVGNDLEWVYIQGIIDDHSRMLLALEAYMSDSGENFARTLKIAVLRYGIPSSAYFDNGGCYVDENVLAACNKLGIAVIHTRTNDGAAKAVIERQWLSLTQDVIPDLVLDGVTTLEGIQKVLDEYRDTYNSKVNRGVGGIPVDRYRASVERHPVRLAKSSAWLDECFMSDRYCHVYLDNTVQIDNCRYSIPDEIALKVKKGKGKTLMVTYDPYHIEETIFTVVGGKKYRMPLEDRLKNADGKRNTPGRKGQLKEQEEERRRAAELTAERRAEERNRARMAGIDPAVFPGAACDPVVSPDLSAGDSPVETSEETLIMHDFDAMMED